MDDESHVRWETPSKPRKSEMQLRPVNVHNVGAQRSKQTRQPARPFEVGARPSRHRARESSHLMQGTPWTDEVMRHPFYPNKCIPLREVHDAYLVTLSGHRCRKRTQKRRRRTLIVGVEQREKTNTQKRPPK